MDLAGQSVSVGLGAQRLKTSLSDTTLAGPEPARSDERWLNPARLFRLSFLAAAPDGARVLSSGRKPRN